MLFTVFLGPFIGSRDVDAQPSLSAAFKQLNRSTPWQEVSVVPVDFNTYHPQGFALVAGNLFVSSVEVVTPTRRFAQPVEGMDRSEGSGKGHLFKMDLQGRMIDQITLGRGAMYHPGGIDFDGQFLWIPVAEYRPNSRSIIYRVDPENMEVHEVIEVEDHLGGIIHNKDTNTLHGVSWGARRFYTFNLDSTLAVVFPEEVPATPYTLNPSHYIDYQDCMYADNSMAICSGLSTYYQNQKRFALGGIELIDLQTGMPVHQVPLSLWTEKGLPLTQNPVTFELRPNALRMYAMPEDNTSRLFIYEADMQ